MRRSASTITTCGICGQTFDLTRSEAPPFCSERCKLIDLGKWMNEEIGLPHEGGPTKGEDVDTEPGSQS